MIIAIDMGNTNIEIGCLDHETIHFTERVRTDIYKTELEYAVLISAIMELNGISAESIDGAIISSVVPPLTQVLCEAVFKIAGVKALVVGAGLKTGLNIKMDNPGTVGADLVVDSVAALAEYGAPCIVIDMGTATTITVVDDKKRYIGGAIIPGVMVSLESLVSGTSQLPRIPMEAPKRAVASNTVDSMKSGIIFGQAALIDGMIDRFEEELGYPCTVVATGGLAGTIIPNCRKEIILDKMLMLKGLRIIYEKNR
ncbi:MAG: type III pantothenate kinase [Lachnospiraceae bacterium]|nr:type III pantothenate kinase [Lachnospiraceae bacterium]